VTGRVRHERLLKSKSRLRFELGEGREWIADGAMVDQTSISKMSPLVPRSFWRGQNRGGGVHMIAQERVPLTGMEKRINVESWTEMNTCGPSPYTAAFNFWLSRVIFSAMHRHMLV